MSFNLDNFKNKPPIAVIKDADINGLSFFKKRLEQLFFSDVIIRNSDVRGKTAKLIIEISCNFSLQQGISNLKAGIWAQLGKPTDANFEQSEFYNLVTQLQEKNDLTIAVEEFSLLFDDCSIIISELYERSIPEQLDTIITQLANHYVALTKGMREVPYEIFIPVFEDENNGCSDAESLVPNIVTHEHDAADYYKFWAAYFDKHENAYMYSFNENSLINGDLNMLND